MVWGGPRTPTHMNTPTHRPAPGRWIAAPALLLSLAAAPAAAQEAPQRIVLVAPAGAALMPAEAAASGRSTSANFRADWQVAGPLAPGASSTFYRLERLAVGPTLPLGPTPPFPVATSPGGAPAGGTQAVTLLGINFQAPGAGVLSANFGPATVPVLASSNLVAAGTSPVGLNGYGNPLGAVGVGLASALGSGLGAAEFVHHPALVLRAPIQVAGELRLDLIVSPGAVAGVFLGGPIPGVAVPIAPFAGAAEIVVNLQAIVGFTPLPTGAASFLFPVPPTPGLAGAVLHLQGLALEGAAGSFTNLLSAPILP